MKPIVENTMKPIVENTMKHALLVGIGYVNTPLALKGPLRDVYKIKETLVDYEITIITDYTEQTPTKKTVVNAFLSLLKEKGSLFFYYSGHGQETPEAIVCLDGVITNIEFKEMLETMDKDSTLIAVMDTCFSGNIFDLTYHWHNDWHNQAKESEEDTKGHVFLLSSSQEDEVSLEYLTPTGSEGALTIAYLETIKEPQTWKSLIEHVTEQLEYQTPQLSTGQRENIDASFAM
jgi:hypothetical protein